MITEFFIVLFGAAGGCLLSVLVGLIGSRRNIGFTLSFLLSLLFTPLVGLIFTLLSDPKPGAEQSFGCVGTLLGIIGGLLFVSALLLLMGIGTTLLVC